MISLVWLGLVLVKLAIGVLARSRLFPILECLFLKSLLLVVCLVLESRTQLLRVALRNVVVALVLPLLLVL